MGLPVYLTVYLYILECSVITLQESTKCTFETTCSKCVQAHPSCAWCKTQAPFPGMRCDSLSSITKVCPEEDIVAPHSDFTMTQDEALSESGGSLDNIVQLKPQKINLKIRPNSPQTFTIQFRPAEDQAVDLYYLMDLSDSMRDDKEKLTGLATLLGNTMKNLTRNFQLGFGSFIDKVVLPYADTSPKKLIAPCNECSAPYGFVNNLPLNEDTSLFEEKVKRSNISGNLDGPEGSLDGVMQALVCTRQIGWREKARKILLLTTDASFHSAGDGKLAGIVTRNDEICHLNSNGIYTKSTEQDYPSVSQIIRQVEEHNITMLFAVTPQVVPLYEELRKLIKGAHIAELAQDSENIVELVKNQYEQISSRIEFQDDAPNNVRVMYHTKCLSSDDTYQQTNVCNGLKDGTTVDFQITIEVTHCQENAQDHKQIFTITPLGLSEAVTVELDLICECDCERPESQLINYTKCSDVGIYQCGICQCPVNRYGEWCQCFGNETTNIDDIAVCRRDIYASICSGRGICFCGECICHQPSESSVLGYVYGPYCECDNFSCLHHNGLICGGPQRGKCDCGSCACNDQWTGEACECPTSDNSCRGSNGELCNWNGVCECGICICDPRFSGPLCQTNLDPEGSCSEHELCVQCIFARNETECEMCPSNFTLENVARLEGVREGEHQCKFKHPDGCNVFYTYKTGEKSTSFRIQTQRDCPKPVALGSVIGVVIGAVVGIGLLTLIIWKLVTMMHDHREYVRFENERLNNQHHLMENPLYKDVVTKFPNPTYGQDPMN